MTRAFLLLAATLTAAGCNSPTPSTAAAAEAAARPEGDAAVPVTIATVTVQPAKRHVNFVGTLYGDQDVTLSSQIEGQLEAVTADLGDQVGAGQTLARIDDEKWRARLREAEANLDKARADEARSSQLAAERVVSPQEYEAVRTRAAVAEAQRDLLVVTIRHATVASPLTGAVARRFVSSGEYVRPGTPLFTVVAEDPLKLRGDVPERFAHELRAGQAVEVRVDAFPERTFPGRLSRISPASNPQNRSVGVEAVVENPDRALKPGFFANAAVVTRTDDRALMVPQEALITFAGVTKLFLVRNGRALEQQVETGTRGGGGLVEIRRGVTADDTVATSGLTKLGNGTPVTVRDAATPPEPQS